MCVKGGVRGHIKAFHRFLYIGRPLYTVQIFTFDKREEEDFTTAKLTLNPHLQQYLIQRANDSSKNVHVHIFGGTLQKFSALLLDNAS